MIIILTNIIIIILLLSLNEISSWEYVSCNFFQYAIRCWCGGGGESYGHSRAGSRIACTGTDSRTHARQVAFGPRKSMTRNVSTTFFVASGFCSLGSVTLTFRVMTRMR
jgi:hypothetical protein